MIQHIVQVFRWSSRSIILRSENWTSTKF